MAKMLMGQIDHARNRLREIVSVKSGEHPEAPTLKGEKDALKEIRAGTRKVTAPVLRKAFDALINEEVIERSKTEKGGYYNNYKWEVTLSKEAPSSIQQALADIFYGEENRKKTDEFEAKSKAYKDHVDRVVRESKRVEDAIVLGDQHAALQALNDFMAMEF